MTVKHLDHLNLTVNNFAETAAWYHRVFGFEIVEQGLYNNRPWGVIKAGDAMLCIYEDPKRTHIGSADMRSRGLHGLNHFALRITDPLAWRETMKLENIRPVDGEEWHWPHSTSWYIEDPTGYQIEVAAWDRDEVRFQQA